MSKFANKNISNKRAEYGESFEGYRARLKKVGKELKQYLRSGTPIWTSCIITNESPGMYRKHRVQGTYRRVKT